MDSETVSCELTCQEIEIIDVKPLAGAGNVKAYVTLLIGDVLIRHCKIVQQPHQKPWFALPQHQFTTPDGERKFTTVVEVPESIKRQMAAAALAAWEERTADP